MMATNSALFSRPLWLDLPRSEDEIAHVLAVDDSLVDRKVIERLLKISSCKVTAVDSGMRALEFLGIDNEQEKSTDAERLKIDLIITDYCMPGMTGYDLLKKIKESSVFKEVPVVIMSSENVLTRIHRCLEEGADDFIVKPVKLSDVERLRDHLMVRCKPDNTIKTDTSDRPPPSNKRKLSDGPCQSTSPTSSESPPSIASPLSSSSMTQSPSFTPSPPSSPRSSPSPSVPPPSDPLDSPIRKLKTSTGFDQVIPDAPL
ncbi:hypothetical protein V2J09_015390 [Rumex salicifolius]